MQHVVADFHLFKIEIAADVAVDLIADHALICEVNEMPAFGGDRLQKKFALLAGERLRWRIISLIVSL